ncbi:MAG: hypothetical protein ACI9N9_001193 [Enterobacterales bacterium]|jgi:hypothetical protein
MSIEQLKIELEEALKKENVTWLREIAELINEKADDIEEARGEL